MWAHFASYVNVRLASATPVPVARPILGAQAWQQATPDRLEQHVKPNPIRVVQASVVVLALVSIGAGLWAMLDARSFYLNAAPFHPYNVHFVHDIGAFQIGLGTCLLAGLALRDALLAVLVGNAFAGVAHFVAHVVDRDRGGHASDPYVFGVIAVVLIALTVARAMAGPTRTGERL